MKIINSRVHGVIDYLVVVFLLAAPSLFSLPETTALFTYVLAVFTWRSRFSQNLSLA